MVNGRLAGAVTEPSLPPADPLISVSAGDLPVILSAPHGGRKPIPGVAERRGDGIGRFSVQRDNNTAELARLVLDKLERDRRARAFGIVAEFQRKYVDANRAAEEAYESAEAKPFYDAYHGALEAAAEGVRRRWGCGLLIDLHGQTAEHESIFRGTDNLRSVSQLIARHGAPALSGAQSILGQLRARGYRILPGARAGEREHHYTGGYITRTYGSHRGTRIDAMQLELGSELRRNASLERTASDLAQAIVVFAGEYLPAASRGAISITRG